MNGVVLAAGGGTRLRPLTDTLPKTLLRVADDRTILDVALGNLAEVGVVDVTVVVGHAAGAIRAHAGTLESTYGVTLHLVVNDKFDVWNNAYSLWLARDALAGGALVLNGDTVHPPVVEERLLRNRGMAPVLLAVDDQKALAEEEMKVVLDADGRMRSINKGIDPAVANGEYIGVTLVEAAAAGRLADALKAVFERDTTLYYEDGYQQYADWGETVRAVPIGTTEWVEVDDHDDLARAREIACRY